MVLLPAIAMTRRSYGPAPSASSGAQAISLRPAGDRVDVSIRREADAPPTRPR